MDQEERKVFWDVLCSLDGKDMKQDALKLQGHIKRPQYLFRYRPVTLSTIDALQTNRLYFSKADYYDDPFDTLIHIDFDAINTQARLFLGADDIRARLHQMAETLKIDSNEIIKADNLLNNLNIEELLKGIDLFLKTNTQSFLKQNIWSVCFSESGINESMWMKYADQYKGFCVIYDMEDEDKLLCGKQDKCQNCVVNARGTSLYPMYYSDQGYDATVFAANLTIALIAQQHLQSSIADLLIRSLPSGVWEQEKITLIKSQCHSPDQEWRMLLSGYANPPVMQERIPHGIILGIRTTENDRKMIIRSAQMAGIEHIYDTYISNQYHIEIREINVN